MFLRAGSWHEKTKGSGDTGFSGLTVFMYAVMTFQKDV